MSIKLKKLQRNLFLGILVSIIFMIGWLFILPSAKLETISYTIGTPISTEAGVYLNNVPAKDSVTLDTAQFDVAGEETKKIPVNYKGENYSVTIKFVAPNIKEVVQTTDETLDFAVGGDYNTIFNVKAPYVNKVNYSVPSNALKVGEQTVDISLYGQKITQKLNVFDANSELGQLLQYDYAHSDLATVIRHYLKDESISESQVAFAYKNTASGKIIQMNENNLMTAASTYKLPLGLYVEDTMADKGYTLSQKLRVSSLYDTNNEYANFVKAYGVNVTIDNLLKETIVHSNNTSAITLAEHFGGFQTLYQTAFLKYGSNEQADIRTLNREKNQTTAGYFIKVLDYLWTNRDKYPIVTGYLEKAAPTAYYEKYVQNVNVWHKYGEYGGSINDTAIVFEKTPYLVALYTNKLSSQQFSKLAYVIHTWHRSQAN